MVFSGWDPQTQPHPSSGAGSTEGSVRLGYRNTILRAAFLAAVFFFCVPVSSAQAPPLDIGPSETFHADVLMVTPEPCGEIDCELLTLQPRSGSFEGQTIEVTINPGGFLGGAKRLSFAPGDRVIVQSQMVNGKAQFVVADAVRTRALGLLLLLFIIAIILLGGWAAVRSMIGMAVSFVLLILVILPAILAGWPPLSVAVTGGIVITVITMLLGHGRHPKTWAALAGIALSLFITCMLALLFTKWAKLSGLADEETLILFREHLTLDTQGLLLAGIVIGTLGVLDDMAIAQASAVFELKAANPLLSARELYRRALRIGSDHIAAGVNTLILAYAGTALPLLLLVASAPEKEGLLTLINREVFATEIVRALVGSIGLLAAVPLSTLFAALWATQAKNRISENHHAHGHHF